jgi:hypothetical protein
MPDRQFTQLYLVHAIKPVSLQTRLDKLKKSMTEFLPFLTCFRGENYRGKLSRKIPPDIFQGEVIVGGNFSE